MHHFLVFPGGKQPLKPKEHNTKLNYKEIFNWFKQNSKLLNQFNKTKEKHMEN